MIARDIMTRKVLVHVLKNGYSENVVFGGALTSDVPLTSCVDGQLSTKRASTRMIWSGPFKRRENELSIVVASRKIDLT